MFIQINELLRQRAEVEMKIRRWRVEAIRRFRHHLSNLPTSVPAAVDDMLLAMEKKLSAVAYDHEEFDDLLDKIEAVFSGEPSDSV